MFRREVERVLLPSCMDAGIADGFIFGICVDAITAARESPPRSDPSTNDAVG
jgi:hypothetical protein